MKKIEGGLTEAEWQELVALEYTISQGYSKEQSDIDRMNSLRRKRWGDF